jgi:hypothetical protein
VRQGRNRQGGGSVEIDVADPSRGRRQLLIIVGGVATIFSLTLAWEVWFRGADIRNTVMSVGQIVILLGLAAVALRGFRWARGCLVIWLGYLTLRFAFITLLLTAYSPLVFIAPLGLTAAVAYGTYILFFSDDVDAYLTAQRPQS